MLDWIIQSAAIGRDLRKHDAELATARAGGQIDTLQDRIAELDRASAVLRASMDLLRARLAAMHRR